MTSQDIAKALERHRAQQVALVALERHRARQVALVARNVRIVEGGRPRDRGRRMLRVMERTKTLHMHEEVLERNFRQAVIQENQERV